MTTNRLKQLEEKAKRLQAELDEVHWKWEDARKALEAKGTIVDYTWGDVLA